MTDNVEFIKKNSESSMDWSIVETLREIIDKIESGEAVYNKCFLVLLNDVEEGDYRTGFRMAQMKGAEAVGLLEIVKSDLLNGINGLPSSFQ